ELGYTGDKSSVTKAAPLAYFGHFDPVTALSAQNLADEISQDVPLSISEDRMQISGEFLPHFSGSYALKLKDESGLSSTRLIEIRLTVDPVPTVTLARPAVGIDPPYLTPNATVIVKADADDKLYGLRSAFLEYRIGREGPVRVLPLAH